MATLINYLKYVKNIEKPIYLLRQLNGTSRWSSSYAKNVLVNSRYKSRNSSKKNSSIFLYNLNSKLKCRNRWSSAIEEIKTNDEKNKEISLTVRKEDIATIPNLLCMTRIVLSPFLGYLVIQQSYSSALGIFVFAGFTDLLDGLIARSFPSQKSMLGSFLDPMADKLLVSTLFVSLTTVGLIPIPLTVLIICRDVCLVCAGFYIRYVSLPFPKTFSRYFDVRLATAKLSPTTVSKLNTLVQLSLVGFTLAASAVDLTDHPWLHGLWYVTAATTVASWASYVVRKDTFKLLRPRKRVSARRVERRNVV